jgi:predicted O-methyltransferase YrrM
MAYAAGPIAALCRWLVTSREVTNFTYDLTELNVRHLASLQAHVLGLPYELVIGYLGEPQHDAELIEHIRQKTATSDRSFAADSEVRFGRRLGWYGFVRALKPRLVIETGVDKGLGACLIAAALRRNAAEGCTGKYYGTDINPRAGYLLSGVYSEFGSVLYGDSLTTLAALDEEVDLFINDSDHSPVYEGLEYQAIRRLLSSRAIVLGDNSHYTGELLAFSQAEGREFIYFQERPSGHWYPGGGIGISFPRRAAHARN